MQRASISIGLRVAPWLYRYLDMVKERAMRTGEMPLMDIVQRVVRRGVRPYIVK